jgi:hypothetical protein
MIRHGRWTSDLAALRIRVAIEDQQHVALPKLYGAPAYARPPVVPVKPVERPFDPDELPIEAVQTDEERELARQLAAGLPVVAAPVVAAPSGPGSPSNGSSPFLRRRRSGFAPTGAGFEATGTAQTPDEAVGRRRIVGE